MAGMETPVQEMRLRVRPAIPSDHCSTVVIARESFDAGVRHEQKVRAVSIAQLDAVEDASTGTERVELPSGVSVHWLRPDADVESLIVRDRREHFVASPLI